MNETSFLSGKVRKQSLALINGSPGPDAPTLKRLLLAQGELAHFFDSPDEGARYIAFVELRRGALRGNHYHLKKAEGVYVLHGEVLLQVEDIQTKERAEMTLRTGDIAEIDTEIAHAYRTIVPGQAVEFSKAQFDAKDVYRYSVPGDVKT